MEEFCGSPFWDIKKTWDTPNPYFTRCFEETVLVWVPCGFLWVLTPLDIYYGVKSGARDIPWGPLNILKVLNCAVLTVLQLILLFPIVFGDSSSRVVYPVDYSAPIISGLTYILALGLVFYGKVKGVRSSGVQFIFWLVLLICQASRFRTALTNSSDSPEGNDILWENSNTVLQNIVEIISFPIVLAQFLLNFWADQPPKYQEDPSVLSKKACPENSSSYISRLLFHWYNGLAVLGYRKPLEYSDLWDLNREDRSETIVPVFMSNWERVKAAKESQSENLSEGKGSKVNFQYQRLNEENDLASYQNGGPGIYPDQSKDKSFVSVLPILVWTIGWTFIFGSILKIFPDLLLFVSPQLLNQLIAFVTPEEATGDLEPSWKGYFFAVILFVSAFIQTLLMAQYSHRMYLSGMRARTALVGAIYRKALLISNAARRESTIGEIVNLMSVDVQKIMDNMSFINHLWSAPMQIIIAMYFLWGILGPSVLAGVGMMILFIPTNAYIAAKARKLQVTQMKYKDSRIKLMNEILSGIKVLKLYAWEPSFEAQILEIRKKEVQVLKQAGFLNGVSNFLWACSPFLFAVSIFGTYVLTDVSHVLDAQKAFVSLSLLNIINMSVSYLPAFIQFSVQAGVGIKRINRFMNSEEIDFGAVTHDPDEKDPIIIQQGNFSWEDNIIVLKNINLRIPQGSLVAIVGTVGSGKSSLLAAILGELDKVSGRVNTQGSIGYVAQQAWIQNATLRENIIFGLPYDPIKYDKVLTSCALKPDLEILPAGDQTEIGERGINLSGGQKQRVAIGRAVYNNSDVLLFDDPLSAVDSHVGKHIFEKVLGPKGTLKKKTRVLVTHGISYLPSVDQIIVLKDGEITEQGTYQELLNNKGAFAEFLKEHITNEDLSELEGTSIAKDLETAVGPIEQLKHRRSRRSISRRDSGQENLSSDYDEYSTDGSISGRRVSAPRRESYNLNQLRRLSEVGITPPKKDVLITAEKSETQSVKASVYIDYLKFGGWVLTFLTLAFYLLFQTFSVGANLWLSDWTNAPVNPNGTQDIQMRNMYLTVYAGLGLSQAISVLIATFLMVLATISSATVLHKKMLSRILKAPMSFFDTTPIGRIVNRFAKDVDVCDNSLPMFVRFWINSFLQVASTIVVIGYTTPIFIVVVIPIGFLYYFVQRVFVSSTRQLKRLESITRSPIYSHFSETVAGAMTIRAYSQQSRFIRESDVRVDVNQASYFPSVTANRWLAVRLETVGNSVILFAAVFAVLGRDTLNPGLVGLSISYALQITVSLNMLVRWSSDLETNIVSVERVKEYTETPVESEWEVPHNKPSPTWPEMGAVTFDHYQTKYREGLELVLRNVTCSIQAGEKIGIVGRTGAGKSSMTLALFRIIEGTGGYIEIDGERIDRLGLHDVRGRITIIPQEPVLFSGTLRMNLDPFATHSDPELWRALELSHLKPFVNGLQKQLFHEISEGGENLSVGQRQLVCLARALLRKTKILVLDEATAAVDLETDDLIQATIRSEFHDSTVITIAHRLNTIMDSSRVLVLDNGEVKEFETPENLLKVTTSIFHGMAKDAGLVI